MLEVPTRIGARVQLGLGVGKESGNIIHHKLQRRLVWRDDYSSLWYGESEVGLLCFPDKENGRWYVFHPRRDWQRVVPDWIERKLYTFVDFPYEQIRQEVQYHIAKWEYQMENGYDTLP